MTLVLAIGMAAAVLASVLWAMRSGQRAAVNRFAHDFELLKREQHTLDSQVRGGEVAAEDAAKQRNELRRRALTLKRLSEGMPDLHDRPVPAAVVVTVVTLGAAVGLYVWQHDAPVRSSGAKSPSVPAQRGDVPARDFDGLMALGQQRFNAGNHAGAFDAYEAASARAPGRVEGWLAQGEALVAAEKGEISPAAMLAFARAEQLSPGNPVSQYYSGLERLQQGDAAAAQAIWLSLKARSQPTAPWTAQLDRGLAVAARTLGQEPPGAQTQIGAAQIQGMVEGLAARLEDDPDDPEGWLMLARSYLVLKRPGDARAALDRLAGLGDVSDAIAAQAQTLRQRLAAQ